MNWIRWAGFASVMCSLRGARPCMRMHINACCRDEEGWLWHYQETNGLFLSAPACDQLVCISEKIGDVSDFCQSPDGYVWCTVRNKGICRISPTGKWKLYPHKNDFLTLDVTSDGIPGYLAFKTGMHLESIPY